MSASRIGTSKISQVTIKVIWITNSALEIWREDQCQIRWQPSLQVRNNFICRHWAIIYPESRRLEPNLYGLTVAASKNRSFQQRRMPIRRKCRKETVDFGKYFRGILSNEQLFLSKRNELRQKTALKEKRPSNPKNIDLGLSINTSYSHLFLVRNAYWECRKVIRYLRNFAETDGIHFLNNQTSWNRNRSVSVNEFKHNKSSFINRSCTI